MKCKFQQLFKGIAAIKTSSKEVATPTKSHPAAEGLQWGHKALVGKQEKLFLATATISKPNDN